MTEEAKMTMNMKGDLIEVKEASPLTKSNKKLFRVFLILFCLFLTFLTFYVPYVSFVGFFIQPLHNIYFVIIYFSVIISLIVYLWQGPKK